MPTTSKRSSGTVTPIDECQATIGYTFRQPDLLRAAFTHTSGANTRQASNERLEFLGDSVLGLVTCEQLFTRFPDYQEGDLTKVKSVIVSRKTCAQFSRMLNLQRFLIVGKGMALQAGEISTNLLADVFESLVAAIFLDGGWEAAKEFVLKFVAPEIENQAKQALASSAKSQLQTLAQREFGTAPRYVVLDEQGPDHDKCFKIAVEIDGQQYTPVWGRNKKDAEIMAAANALAELTGEPIPYSTSS
jgi:ribonuclease III